MNNSKEVIRQIEIFLKRGDSLPPGGLDLKDSFHKLGVDSVDGTELVFFLSEHFKVELDPTMLFDARTVFGFADMVADLLSN